MNNQFLHVCWWCSSPCQLACGSTQPDWGPDYHVAQVICTSCGATSPSVHQREFYNLPNWRELVGKYSIDNPKNHPALLWIRRKALEGHNAGPGITRKK